MVLIKKIICIICSVLFVVTLCTGCDKTTTDYTNPQIINFSMSEQELKQYDGEIVKIVGFFSLTMNEDEIVSYITATPNQITPELEVDNKTLKNSIAVYSNKLPQYISCPIVVTGKLVFGTFTDGYGSLSYNYKIEEPQIKVAEVTDIPEHCKDYYELAQKEYPFELFNMYAALKYYIFYDEYELDPEIDLKNEIDLTITEAARVALEKEENDVQKDFLDIWNQLEGLCKKTNKLVKDKKYDKLKDLEAEFEEIETNYNNFLNSQKIE